MPVVTRDSNFSLWICKQQKFYHCHSYYYISLAIWKFQRKQIATFCSSPVGNSTLKRITKATLQFLSTLWTRLVESDAMATHNAMWWICYGDRVIMEDGLNAQIHGGQLSTANNSVNIGGKSNHEEGTQRIQYSIPGILHFIQHEWARFEMERSQWEVERAELLVSHPNAL